MRRILLVLVLFLAPMATHAAQLSGQQAYEVLTAKQRVYSGGSVSVFRPNGTFVFTHSNGSREEGTYRITQSGLVKVEDKSNGTKYSFVVSERNGTYCFTYRSGPGRGNTYTFE